MEELNLENLIFGEKEETPPKPLRLHWIVLAAIVLVAVSLAAFWPRGQAGDIYGELAPDMVSWQSEKDLTGMFGDYIVFTPKLDPEKWGAGKISVGVKSEDGFFITTSSSQNPHNLTVDSGNSATLITGEGIDTNYVEFVAWAGEHIVGYAVARVQLGVGDGGFGMTQYEVEILGSVTFPLMDGEFQDVTEAYVEQQINELKKQ